MARTKISEFSATPGNNTDIDGINIAEGCAPSGINDAIRELMSQLKDFQAGTAGDSFNGPVGTTTAAAGAFTTLSASSTVSGTGFSNYLASPPAIGGTAAAAGSFTTLSASSTVTLSGGTANGVLYLNASKVATSGSALTFDGTLLSNAGSSSGAVLEVLRLSNNGVGDGTQAQVTFRAANTNYAQITGGFSGAPALINNVAAAGYHALQIGAAEQMRLTSTGLGIGTSSPTTKLDVNGDARIGGTSVSQSLLTVGGGSTSAAVNLRGATGSAYAWQISSNAFVGSALEFTRSTAVGGTTFSTPSMLLDSSGNLGLGVTPSGWDTALKAIQVNTQGVFASETNAVHVMTNVYYNSGYKYIGTGYATDYYQYLGAHVWRTASSGSVGNTISWTQAMTLDASGNLGVGATNPSAYGKFVVTGSGTTASVLDNGAGRITDTAVSGGGSYTQYYKDLTPSYVCSVGCYSPATSTAQSAIVFSDYQGGWTERARIDSSGNLLVGKTVTTYTTNGVSLSSNGSNFSYTSGAVLAINRNGTDGNADEFYKAGTLVGSISVTGSATAYNTSSDYRLKDNPQPLTGSGAFIDALQPKTWNWKADGSKGVGFIAHEVQEVSPSSVVGEKDGEQMQAMEYGSAEFIANIIAELQSLRKRVAQLEKGN